MFGPITVEFIDCVFQSDRIARGFVMYYEIILNEINRHKNGHRATQVQSC